MERDIFVRGNVDEDIAEPLQDKVRDGQYRQILAKVMRAALRLEPGLPQNIGARVGDTITIINPEGQIDTFWHVQIRQRGL